MSTESSTLQDVSTALAPPGCPPQAASAAPVTLKQQTIKGLAWSGTSQFGKQVCQLIITAVLARLLSPKDFGLLGMATVFIQLPAMFGELGLTGALIQKKDIADAHYASGFWMSIAMGGILTALMLLAAPLIGRFYGRPELVLILRVISATFLIGAFGTVQQAILMRKMQFKSLTIRNLTAVVVSGVVGISAAWMGWGVWSLVLQFVSFQLMDVVLLWLLSDWRPRAAPSVPAMKETLHFSLPLTGFNVTSYFATNVDYLLIGKFLGAGELGLYTLAYKCMLLPIQNISWTIMRVMFPAFAKIQDHPDRVQKHYAQMLKGIALVTFPMMCGLFVLAPEAVEVAFGSQWAGAIGPIRIFCFCGMAQSLGTTAGTIYRSQGRPDMELKLGVINALCTAAVVMGSLRWGINGVALGYTVFSVLWANVLLLSTRVLIGGSWRELYKSIAFPVLLSLALTMELFVIKGLLNVTALGTVVVLSAVFGCSYLALLVVFRQIQFKNKVVMLGA